MGGDMVVALGRATVDGQTLFGQNSDLPVRQCQVLRRTPGREFALGERIRAQYLELPQARQAYLVLGSAPEGWWGYTHGINERGLVAGCSALECQRSNAPPGLTGGDLVRLALERCRTARQAVDLVTSLVERHGQAGPPGDPVPAAGDHAFLLADGVEALVLEATGNHWVYQEIREVRAVSNVCVIRQDWDRIAHGLAEIAIGQGHWPADGSKLDFAGTFSANPVGQGSALRRWGRATLLLEQQNGHIDAAFLRRVLGDHYEGTHFESDPLTSTGGPLPLCQHPVGLAAGATAASWIAQAGRAEERLPIAWSAFGPPCASVYFPLFLEGELPTPFTVGGRESSPGSWWWRLYWLEEHLRHHPEQWNHARDSFGRLQARFDADAEDFAVEAATLKRQGQLGQVQHLAGIFMQQCLEQFETVLASIGYRVPGIGQHRRHEWEGKAHSRPSAVDHWSSVAD
jgi:secernin